LTDSASKGPGARPTRPFSRFEWLLAGRYLRARRKEAFISVIASLTMVGVAIGVATLIVVMSVMNGFRGELLDKILGLNGHFTAHPIESQFTDYKETVAALEQVEGVTFAVYFVEGQVLASGLSSTGVSVRGMDEENLKKLSLLYNSAEQGGFDQWDDSKGVAIGYRLAQQLGVGIGDSVQIINPDGAMTPFGSTPQIRSYPVNAIYNLGMVEFDSFYMYMPLEPAQDYFRMVDEVLKPGMGPLDPLASDEEIDAAYERIPRASAVEIFIDDPDEVSLMRQRLQSAPGIRPLVLTDWQQRNETFFSALQVERVVMFTILSMIILVAAFNIISSLIMLVKDKAADIAVLRTMGATRGAIMRVFSITGTTIGFIGTAVGTVLGLIVAANAETLRASISNLLGVTLFPPEVFFLSSLPSRTDPVEVTVVVGMALGLTFLATLYPAWRAAQYDPVEALRYE
jgi:lipoprotein-releasing system permease protein